METQLVSIGHIDHALIWILTCNQTDTPVCLACVIELLEEEGSPSVKKKWVLSEFFGILSRQPLDVIGVLQQDPRVVRQMTQALLEVSAVEDKMLASMAVEGCRHIICQMKDDELLVSVLETIIQRQSSHQQSDAYLPGLILLGRLLNDIPALPTRILDDYISFVEELCISLDSASEVVQSEIMYILHHLFLPDFQPCLPSKLIIKVQHLVIRRLGSVQSPECITNMLGLLKQLLSSEDCTAGLMRIQIEGNTLPSVLKRLLISRRDTQNMAAVSCINSIMRHPERLSYGATLLDGDLAEFLFEALCKNTDAQMEIVFNCLKQLSDVDQFFSKCHSLYGIESVIRAVDIALSHKHYAAAQLGFTLLTTILQRQPESVPLFNHASSVKSCLELVLRGLKNAHQQVLLAAMKATKQIMQKRHLIAPVQFGLIGQILEYLGQRVKNLPQSFISAPKKHLHRKVSKTSSASPESSWKKHVDLICNYVGIACNCSSLSVACMKDPSISASSFLGPSAKLLDGELTSEAFTDLIWQICDENVLPLIMVNWSLMTVADVFEDLFKILNNLFRLSMDKMSHLLEKLFTSGLLNATVELKATHRQHEKLSKLINLFLTETLTQQCKELFAGEAPHSSIIETGVQALQCRLCDAPQLLYESGSEEHLSQTILIILYICYLHDDRCLSPEELHRVLGPLFRDILDRAHSVPASQWKCVVFLLSVSYCVDGFDCRDENIEGFTSLVRSLSSLPVTSWFTQHPFVLHWCFSDAVLAEACGKQVLETSLLLSPLHSAGVSCPDIDPSLPEDSLDYSTQTTNESVTKVPQSDLMYNDFYRQTLLVILMSAEMKDVKENIVSMLAVTIKKSRQTPDERGREFMAWCQHALPSCLQSALALSNHPDDSVFDLLSLVSQLRGTEQQNDVKVIYHVLNHVTRSPEPSERVQVKCLQYLCSLLPSGNTTTASDNGRTVSCLILQNSQLLTMLQCHLRECSCDSALYRVSLQVITGVMMQEQDRSMQAQQLICVTLASLLEVFHSARVASKLATIQFLKSFLSQQKSNVVSLQYQSQSVSISDCVSDGQQLRQLWIYLQQTAVQHPGDVRDATFACMEQTLTFANRISSKLADHLAKQPWNRLLIKVILEDTKASEEPSLSFLSFLTVLMSRDCAFSVTAELCAEKLMNAYITTEIQQGQYYDALTNLCKKLLDHSIPGLSKKMQESVKKKLSANVK